MGQALAHCPGQIRLRLRHAWQAHEGWDDRPDRSAGQRQLALTGPDGLSAEWQAMHTLRAACARVPVGAGLQAPGG